MIPCHLTRRANGLYLLTFYSPVIAEIGKTGVQDAYMRPGDPVGVNNLCEWAVKTLWGLELEKLETRKVFMDGGLRGRDANKD